MPIVIVPLLLMTFFGEILAIIKGFGEVPPLVVLKLIEPVLVNTLPRVVFAPAIKIPPELLATAGVEGGVLNVPLILIVPLFVKLVVPPAVAELVI